MVCAHLQEVISAQGAGIQAFGACNKQGLLAYVTQVLSSHWCSYCCCTLTKQLYDMGTRNLQEARPTLVLQTPSDSKSQSTALKGEQTSTAVTFSHDGKHVLVARGHPAPNLEVYCCKSVRSPPSCFLHTKLPAIPFEQRFI